jgi:hypothetical protein
MATTQEPKTRKGLRPIPLGWATFWLAAVALVTVAVLGRYETRGDNFSGVIWRVDRWTGEVVLCSWGAANPFCSKFPPPQRPTTEPARPIDLSKFMKPQPENR